MELDYQPKFREKVKIKPKSGFLKAFRSKTFFPKRWGFFRPRDYDGDSSEERKNLAYQDAKQHADFYKDLVKQGVYPEGTKVKVKKERHSDSYTIELFMPKITPLNESLFGRDREDEIPEITDRIIRIARKHGYSDKQVYTGVTRYHDDISIMKREDYQRIKSSGRVANFPDQHLRNYGVDKDGKIKYLDRHILIGNLPFEKRKDFSKSKSKSNLEGKVVVSIISLITGIALSISSLTATGNAIANLTGTNTGLMGMLLFVIGLFGLMFGQKKQTSKGF